MVHLRLHHSWCQPLHVNLAEVAEILDDIVADDERAGEVIRRMRALVKALSVSMRTCEPL